MPLPCLHLARDVFAPLDLASWVRTHLHSLAVSATQMLQQFRKALKNGAGKHPWRNLAPASRDQRKIQELRAGAPPCLGQHTADSAPAKARANYNAPCDLASDCGAQRHGTNAQARMQFEPDAVSPRDDVRLKSETT